MTRTAREISVYGYYHVVQKGCGGQLIFEDADDRLYLIRLIASKCQKFKVDVIAWCLMDNHIHLLLDDGHAHLSDCMHSITTAYAMYFNSKTGRRGPVFQDRFKSVPILDDDQLLNCVRYIHDNPAKARIGTASLYRWRAALASIWAIREFVRLIACSGCSGIPRDFLHLAPRASPMAIASVMALM